MVYSLICSKGSVWKFFLIVLFIFWSGEADADNYIDSSRLTPLEGRRSESLVVSNGSDYRSPLDYVYETLFGRGLNKMCSLMRNLDEQELNKLLGDQKQDFTILAPSDEAFALIPGSQFEELKNNKQKTIEFVSQHIIPALLDLYSFRTFDEREVLNANGVAIHVTAYPNGFVINGANVVDGDIRLGNTKNLVHIIDRVIYPKKEYNLLELIEENPDLTQISSFLALSGLQKELTTNDSFTFFAPNDEAFRAIPWPITQQMLSNNTFLRLLLANHLIPGKHYSTGLPANQLYSIGGNRLNFTSSSVQSRKLVLVNLVPVINGDLIATNGVIHIITRILLPKELMDDCNCLPNTTTPKPNHLSQNGSTTLHPLLLDMLAKDVNSIDRRIGSVVRSQNQNGDHFSSTPKSVTFKSFWDDIFGTSEDPSNVTDAQNRSTSNFTPNDTQTSGDQKTTPWTLAVNVTTDQNTTDLPFIWQNLLTSETPQTSDRFTNKPTTYPNNTRMSIENQSKPEELRQFTPGVEYDRQYNDTRNDTNRGSTVEPSKWTRPYYRPEDNRRDSNQTGEPSVWARPQNRPEDNKRDSNQTGEPSLWTRPYYRPEDNRRDSNLTEEPSVWTRPHYRPEDNRRDSNQTGEPSLWTRPYYRPEDSRRDTNQSDFGRNTSSSDTTLPIANSYFRPTVKPYFRPTAGVDAFTPYPGRNETVSPYDRRYETRRGVTPPVNQTDNQFERRSRYGAPSRELPFEQTKEVEPIQQEIEPHYTANQTYFTGILNQTFPHQRDLAPERYPRIQDKPFQPFYDNRTQDFNQRPYFESNRTLSPQRNDSSRYRPLEDQPIEQKHYSPVSWTHQTNRTDSQPKQLRPYLTPNASSQTYPRETVRPQFNWWDSRYTPEQYPTYYNPPTDSKSRAQPAQPKPHITPYPSVNPQSRYDRTRDYRPRVEYEDEHRRPTHVDAFGRPIYRPSDTKSRPVSRPPTAYTQTPYRRQQPPHEVKRTQYPPNIYARKEPNDRVVPYYDPYMRPQQIPVSRDYPYVHTIDHSYYPYYPTDEIRPPVSDPQSRDQRLGPAIRRRPADGRDSKDGRDGREKTNYDDIKRRGDKPVRRTDYEKPKPIESDLKTISEIIESPDLMVANEFKYFNILKELINESGLWEALDRPTTYVTIFMPTDEAFKSITDGSIEDIRRNPKLIRDLLTQHILGYSLPPQNLKNNMKVKSLNGESHLINIVDGGKILIDGIDVIAATSAKNGNVYVIDKVLDRSGRKSRSIVDELRKRSDLSTFASLIQRSDFRKMLSEDSGPFTVFVPNNNALNQLNTRELNYNKNLLNDLLKKHVINGSIFSNQFSGAEDSAGPQRDIKRIGLSSDDRIPTKFITSDIITENGVIHVIDSVLPEKPNITDKSQNYADQSSDGSNQSSIANITQDLGIRRFMNWLNKSGIIDDIVRDGRQYTVVVPTDRAVGKLPLKLQSILNSEPTKLKTLLEYHVIPGFVNTRNLRDNEILKTINRKDIRVNRLGKDNALTLSGAPINRQTTDKNMLVISVDSVLYPPQGSIQEIVSKSPLLKTFNEILKFSEIEDDLQRNPELTIFAPKDEAINQTDPTTLQRLKTDKNFSREFIRRHILPKIVFTSALPVSNDGNNIIKELALNGDTLKIHRKQNCVSVNGILLSFADITATNGVLHIIDHII